MEMFMEAAVAAARPVVPEETVASMVAAAAVVALAVQAENMEETGAILLLQEAPDKTDNHFPILLLF